MRRFLLTTALTAAVALSMALPATGVVKGQLDGNQHPNVGMYAAMDAEGNYMWRCTGTLISEDVFLTAGHCVEDDVDDDGEPVPVHEAFLYFSNGENPDTIAQYDDSDDAPDPQPLNISTAWASGQVRIHPDYNPAFWQYDFGVVLIDTVYNEDFEALPFASLPAAGVVDRFATRQGRNHDDWVTAVGYGLQQASANGKHDQADRVRYVAELDIVNTRGAAGTADGSSFTTSGNSRTGGTCFGDSGGPNFHADTDVILGVTSFGLNNNCAGVGGVSRLDRPVILDWVAGCLDGNCKD